MKDDASHKLNLILPMLLSYLPASELCRISLASSLNHSACSLLLKEIQIDISRGQERVRVQCIGTESRILPINFRYTSQSMEHVHIVGSGCSCLPDSCGEKCPCAIAVEGAIQECGPLCLCSSCCSHRITQRGVSVNLKLVHTGKRGWGVVADAKIESGSFIAEYVGERIRNDLADERLIGYDLASKGHALLIIRQVLPSGLTLRSNIDATLVGNIARFFNHSCDPNLELVIVHRSGCLLPSVALYSIRNIEAGKELTFSYGASASPSPLSSVQGGKECLCGASGCKGVMPAQ